MKFPIVDAYLVEPEEGKGRGKISICTNMLAPGMVLNEIPLDRRGDICVLGSLTVSREGAERLIVNALAHESVEYVILFGEETLSFRPSTNLLLALMNGYDSEKSGNWIVGGRGVSPHYPSISAELLDQFRKSVVVLPLYKHEKCSDVIEQYNVWLKDRVPQEVYDTYLRVRSQKKIYYDSLLEMVAAIEAVSASRDGGVALDPKDFQHLQPPVYILDENTIPESNEGGTLSSSSSPQAPSSETLPSCPFFVERSGANIKALISFTKKNTSDAEQKSHLGVIKGTDSFLMAYSIMKFMNEEELILAPDHQLYLGAELSRIEMELKSNLVAPSFINSSLNKDVASRNIEAEIIPVQERVALLPDKLFYYKVAVKENMICVQSLAFDTCTSVFELRSKTLHPIIAKLAHENRFQDYQQQALHRFDVGVECGRAAVAVAHDKLFFQDFRNLFAINTTNYPLFTVEADTFLANHREIITRLYTAGITMQHPDEHKGTMRSGVVLAIYRNSEESLKKFPGIYSSGSVSTEQMRSEYKQQLLNKGNDGTYTYGSRTRAHFGFDQLEQGATRLKNNPKEIVVIQRFDYNKDMTITKEAVTNTSGEIIRHRIKASKDPCLTHDIYWVQGGKLHSFHIARAHNIVNAYPENIFGLFDAYDKFMKEHSGLPLGDMYVLSSRANILLLTEEQKAKKIIAEPAKPAEITDRSSGPILLAQDSDVKTNDAQVDSSESGLLSDPVCSKGVTILEASLSLHETKPNHEELMRIENYHGENILEKAVYYLETKGMGHNNPIIGTCDPKTDDGRLVFFQCNKRGEELHATAVFKNGSRELVADDRVLCNYLATEFSKRLNIPLGKLFLFYVPMYEGAND